MPTIDVAQLFLAFSVLLFSLTVHEMAHAWTADQLGDPTARLLGRVSLNPIVHADPIGTVLFPLIAMIGGIPLIGWARPVPVKVSALRHPRRDYMLVAAAGPASNLVIAFFSAAVLAALPISPVRLGEPNVSAPLAALLSRAIQLNLLLAIFNMLPIPPLDGGNVLSGLLPRSLAVRFDQIRPYGFLLIYALVATNVFNYVVIPPYNLLPFLVAVTDSSATVQSADTSTGRQRVVSGMRPTGRLHIGHLIGALGNWVPLQSNYDCFYFVADWHALTSDFADTTGLTSYAYENVADWIGAGLDPEQSTFFVQSLVPEHAELYLLLSMVVPVPWLERVPTYKEQQEDLKEKDLSSIGFLGYPLLQTADVTIYDAEWVPVGGDQVAHLEFAREAVRRFNNFFGEVLIEPKPMLTDFKRLPGLDGDKKMSKSLGNTIDLADTAADVVKKVKRMSTDPKRVRADVPGTVEGNPVFIYHDAFNPNVAEVDDLKARYREGRVGDVEVKTKLAAALNAYLEPIRERRTAAMARPDHLKEILVEGSRRARGVAAETMGRVREAMKIAYK